MTALTTASKTPAKSWCRLSNAENQGAFKWVSNKGFQGFDIELVKLIDNELAARLGRSLEFVPIPVPWAQLLDTPAQGRADFIISSITKLEDRRRDFRVEFSDGYYCTTHALIYRVGKPDRPIRDMITGKVVGVQDKTTNARLAEAMAKEGSLQIKAFDTTETLIDELLRSEIDYGIVDTPFAITAQLQNRSNGRDRLSFKEFKQVDFPPINSGRTSTRGICARRTCWRRRIVGRHQRRDRQSQARRLVDASFPASSHGVRRRLRPSQRQSRGQGDDRAPLGVRKLGRRGNATGSSSSPANGVQLPYFLPR